jgi:cytochrome c peroxidase
MHKLTTPLAIIAATLLVACGADDPSPTAESTYAWNVPEGFPLPRVPEDNPMSEAKVELGRHLFYDTRLSVNETTSCATCHKQELAFTDGKTTAEGATGDIHPRNSMALVNVAYASALNWANPVTTSLEQQAMVPLFNEDPVELGWVGRVDEILGRLRADERYPAMFEAAFPDADGELVSLDHVVKAISAFERTLISGNSPFDQYMYGGDDDALSASAKRGMELFFSERLECFHCHGGFNFSDSNDHENTVFREVAFHNNGLYNIDDTGNYPEGNQGLYDSTGRAEDRGRFRAPTLRNIALTAPYMHDGSIATLEEIVDHYAAGGRFVTDGPYFGDGRDHPNKSQFVSGFLITDEEKADLVAFLESLTDETFINDPRFGDPFAQAGPSQEQNEEQ